MQRQHDSFGRGGRCYTREKRGDSRFREKGWNEVSKIYIFAGEIGFAIKGFRIKFNSAWYAPVHAAVGILIQQSFESWQALWSAANIFMLFLLPLPPQTVHRPRLPFRRPLPLPFLLSSRSLSRFFSFLLSARKRFRNGANRGNNPAAEIAGFSDRFRRKGFLPFEFFQFVKVFPLLLLFRKITMRSLKKISLEFRFATPQSRVYIPLVSECNHCGT